MKRRLLLLKISLAAAVICWAIGAQTVIKGSRKLTGSVETGYNSGKTGYSGWYGATDGKVQGWSVPDTAGSDLLYLLSSSAGVAGYQLQDTGSVTCPTLPADAPSFTCHQTAWVKVRYAADETSSSTWTITGATHGLGTCDVVVSTYDGSSPRALITPATLTCNTSTFDVTITWGSPQAGRVVILR